MVNAPVSRPRKYQVGASSPTFTTGNCPQCRSVVGFDAGAPYSDDVPHTCGNCGASTPRRRLVLEALAELELVDWGLLASNFWIGDTAAVGANDYVYYDMSDIKDRVAKWHHHVAYVVGEGADRLTPIVNSGDDAIVVSVSDRLAADPDAGPAPASVQVMWWRFGLSKKEAAPAWRQALFGAASLIETYPAAAVVMIAAGFEAFFIETARIKWVERGLDVAGFDSLNSRNPAVTGLMGWLPAVVGLGSLSEDRMTAWQEKVNRRRNHVVHRGNVHITSGEARDSLRVALNSIVLLDEAALVRPHAYWTAAAR